jgi:hypothetical protein
MVVKVLGIGLAWSTSAVAVVPPSPAEAVGYTHNTLSSTFGASRVDVADSRTSGFDWYAYSFFGSHADPAGTILNPDGSVTLERDPTNVNAELATLSPANNSTGFVGVAFGGGAYIEAVIKFDPSNVAQGNSHGWPAFWSMAAEHLLMRGEQWAGRPEGHNHFIEVDFMEYDMLSSGRNYYGANLHDWYGVYKKTCQAYCDDKLPFSKARIQVPQSTDFTEYHRYGFLWVPATDTTDGHAQFYFDGRPVGTQIHWHRLRNEFNDPVGQSWEFSILDNQHLVLVLGTGVHQPMTVRSVNVWQASTEANMRN